MNGLTSSSLLTLLVLIFSHEVLSAEPQLSRICKMSDTECLKIIAQEVVPKIAAGMPELGTEPVDPMYISERKFEIGRLKLTLASSYITGLKDAVIKDFSLDITKKLMKISYLTDLAAKAKYKASGQLLILPISGDGDITIDLKDLFIEMIIPFEISKNKDGEDIFDLQNYDFNYDVQTGAHFDLTNLFNGNKEMSSKLLTFINDKWKTIMVEFGKPMLKEVMEIIFNSVQTYLKWKPMKNFVEI